jgi:Spy/CpxP family protein refolding chaperone
MKNEALNSRWKVSIAALLVFALGFLAGALSLNVIRKRSDHSRRDRFERLVKRLELSDQQRVQVEQVFAETRQKIEALRKESEPGIEEIRRQADERLKRVLTPEQWNRFEVVKSEWKNRRERHRRSEE